MITALFKKLKQRIGLSSDEEQALRDSVAEVRRVGADEPVVRSGEELNSSVLLLDGWLARSKDLAGGERQITQLHVPGDFADLHGFTLKRLDHDVCTLTDCRLAVFPHERIARMARDYPRLAWVYLAVDQHRRGNRARACPVLGQRSALSRMAHLFCELHARLDVVGRAARDGYEFPLTQRELSECLGLTVVHANRTLQELRRRGLVELENRQLTIRDRGGLEGVAQFDAGYLYLERRRL